MQNPNVSPNWRRLVFALLIGAAAMLAGCSAAPVFDSSPVVNPLRLPAELRRRAELRRLREAVEADSFPKANAHGL